MCASKWPALANRIRFGVFACLVDFGFYYQKCSLQIPTECCSTEFGNIRMFATMFQKKVCTSSDAGITEANGPVPRPTRPIATTMPRVCNVLREIRSNPTNPTTQTNRVADVLAQWQPPLCQLGREKKSDVSKIWKKVYFLRKEIYKRFSANVLTQLAFGSARYLRRRYCWSANYLSCKGSSKYWREYCQENGRTPWRSLGGRFERIVKK